MAVLAAGLHFVGLGCAAVVLAAAVKGMALAIAIRHQAVRVVRHQSKRTLQLPSLEAAQ